MPNIVEGPLVLQKQLWPDRVWTLWGCPDMLAVDPLGPVGSCMSRGRSIGGVWRPGHYLELFATGGWGREVVWLDGIDGIHVDIKVTSTWQQDLGYPEEHRI